MQQFHTIFKKCTLFSGFNDFELEIILSKLGVYIKNYDRHKTIRYDEVEVSEIGIVLKGTAYTSKSDIFGNRFILDELAEGSTFGESLAFTGAVNSPVSIVSAESSVIAFVPLKKIKDAFLPDFAYSRQLTENLIKLLAQKNILLQIKNDILSQKTIREKLLLYFEYEAKTANSKTFRIKFSREELADFLSLNSSALSRELGKMRDEGILAFKKNKFTIKQIDK